MECPCKDCSRFTPRVIGFRLNSAQLPPTAYTHEWLPLVTLVITVFDALWRTVIVVDLHWRFSSCRYYQYDLLFVYYHYPHYCYSYFLLLFLFIFIVVIRVIFSPGFTRPRS